MLRAAGFEFDTQAVDVDETIRSGEAPRAYVRRLAIEKSARAQEIVDGWRVEAETIFLGADTVVVIDGEILGKPVDGGDAERMLRRLSGRRHDVMTGISLRKGPVEMGGVETTAVYFSVLRDADVTWYVASGEGTDKAGGYAIQGLASRFIPRIEGSYSSVVGLPVEAVCDLLRSLR